MMMRPRGAVPLAARRVVRSAPSRGGRRYSSSLLYPSPAPATRSLSSLRLPERRVCVEWQSRGGPAVAPRRALFPTSPLLEGGAFLRRANATAAAGGNPPNNNEIALNNDLTTSSGSRIVAGYVAGEGSIESSRPPSDGYTGHQRNLLEYTRSILPDTAEYPPGTLSYKQIVQISNCIHQWISSGEHRYLGAEQAELLMKRLIAERGGGRSLPSSAREDDASDQQITPRRRTNEGVAWEMYHFPAVMDYLNALYHGEEFAGRVLSILDAFEAEYGDVSEPSSEEDDAPEVPYKSIISSLCNLGTVHAAAAAERVLHRFETRLSDKEEGFVTSNPPTTETYNAVLSCWKRSGGAGYPGQPPPYRHEANLPRG